MDFENIEIFLNTIRNYPEIYAMDHADYKNAYKKEVAWKKVQEKMGIDVKTMKSKWRNLRDTYRKYKQSHQASSGNAKKLANWQWADQMSFIDTDINLMHTDGTLETDKELDTSTISNDDDGNEYINFIEIDQVSNNEQNEFVSNELKIVQKLETAETTAKNNPTREISRKRRRIRNSDPVDKVINYLKTRDSRNTDTAENLVKIPCDRIDMEFLGHAHTVKKFSLQNQAIVKLQIAKIITQAQLKELNAQPNSNFGNILSSNTIDILIDNDSDMSRLIPSGEQQQ